MKNSVETLIKAFERKAGDETIVGAVLYRPLSEDEPADFPTDPMTWADACEYLRIAGGEYGGPLPLCWTESRVLMPVIHELGQRSGSWCIAAPRSPTAHRFAMLYDSGDPEGN